MSIAERTGYSAAVDLKLKVDGELLSLAEVAPDFCVLKQPATIAACKAEIVVTIDGKVQRRAVEILPRTSGDDRRVLLRGI